MARDRNRDRHVFGASQRSSHLWIVGGSSLELARIGRDINNFELDSADTTR